MSVFFKLKPGSRLRGPSGNEYRVSHINEDKVFAKLEHQAAPRNTKLSEEWIIMSGSRRLVEAAQHFEPLDPHPVLQFSYGILEHMTLIE